MCFFVTHFLHWVLTLSTKPQLIFTAIWNSYKDPHILTHSTVDEHSDCFPLGLIDPIFRCACAHHFCWGMLWGF